MQPHKHLSSFKKTSLYYLTRYLRYKEYVNRMKQQQTRPEINYPNLY